MPELGDRLTHGLVCYLRDYLQRLGRPARDAVADADVFWLHEFRKRIERSADPHVLLELPATDDGYPRLERFRREAAQRSDSHELLLGVGLLTAGDGAPWTVRRHLLICDATIVVEPGSDTLRVTLPADLRWRAEDPEDGGMSSPVFGSPFSLDVSLWLQQWGRHVTLPYDVDRWDDSAAGLGVAPALVLRRRNQDGALRLYDAIAADASPRGLARLVAPVEEAGEQLAAVLGNDPLLPLPTNREQRRIVEQLRTDRAVVVQGPPGTGKTHTIANLICALLADGRRVLITSPKEQALRVLRDFLPDEIRQLCVLMTGPEDADELDRSLITLSELSAQTDVDRLEVEIERLRHRRNDLHGTIRNIVAELRASRLREYVTHPPYGRTLAEMATILRAGRDRYDWIDRLPEGAPAEPPLTAAEATQVASIFHTLPPDTVKIGNVGIKAAATAATTALAGCGLVEPTVAWDAADWRTTAVDALLARRDVAYWTALFDDATAAAAHRSTLTERDVEVLPGVTPRRLLGQARQLRAHLSQGSRLGRFLRLRATTDLLESCTVDGLPPATTDDLDAIIGTLRAEIAVGEAVQAWTAAGVPIASTTLRRRLAQLTDIAAAAAAIRRMITARDAVEDALRVRTRADWDTLVRLVEAGPALALAAELDAAHPALAGKWRADPAWDERARDFPAAWAWAVERRSYEAQRPGDPALEQRLDEADQRLAAVTRRLAGQKALLHCLRRMTDEQRQALQSYRAAATSLGRGTGKYRDRYLAAMRSAMEKASGAVPAWVMPLSAVADNVPARPDVFDVVLVDEASQAPVESLYLSWLAPRIVVVGDEQQCTPGLSPNIDLGSAFALLDRHLGELDEDVRQGLLPTSNLYALMSARARTTIRLSEHFRCMPEIIGWSSREFYDGRLIPLRQYGADRLEPLQVVTVPDAVEQGQDATLQNGAEAVAIADQVRKLVEDPANRDRTVGVVVLPDCRQAKLIRSELDKRHLAVRVGSPTDFQGEERHIILLSMVATEPRRVVSSARERRRYNVAASRARDQMWLFTSMDLADLDPRDLRALAARLHARTAGPARPRPGGPARVGDAAGDLPRAPAPRLRRRAAVPGGREGVRLRGDRRPRPPGGRMRRSVRAAVPGPDRRGDRSRARAPPLGLAGRPDPGERLSPRPRGGAAAALGGAVRPGRCFRPGSRRLFR